MEDFLKGIVKYGITPEDCVDWKKLNRYTQRTSFSDVDTIGLGKLEELHIIGTDIIGTEIGTARPGCYCDERKKWMLVYGASQLRIRKILDRYGEKLNTLDVRFTTLEMLDFYPCMQLRRVNLEYNAYLYRLPALEKLVKLESFQVRQSGIGPVLNVSKMTGLKELKIFSPARSCKIEGLSRLCELKILNLSEVTVVGDVDLGCMPHLEEAWLYAVTYGCIRLDKEHKALRVFLSVACKLDNPQFLMSLAALECLVLNECEIPFLPDLENCRKLSALRLYDLQIESVGKLPAGLNELVLSNIKINRIPDQVRLLNGLRSLELRSLKLEELPVWLADLGLPMHIGSSGEGGICLLDVTVSDVDLPEGITIEAENLRDWLIVQQPNAEKPLNEIKVVFLGDGEAGKSLVVKRLLEKGKQIENFDGDATPGIAIFDKHIHLPDRNVKVHYWDFGGQEILHAMHRIFLTQRTVYVVVLNARNDTQDERAKHWLRYIYSFDEDAQVLLVLNKTDQNPRASINETELRRRYPNLPEVVRLSAKTDSQDAFNEKLTKSLEELIGSMENLRFSLPPAWQRVKRALEEMEDVRIDNGRFNQICDEAGMDKDPGKRAALERLLTDLGVCFRCGTRGAKKKMLMRPDWVTNAVYKLLFNRHLDSRNGILAYERIEECIAGDAADLWCVSPEMDYEPDDAEYIMNVMESRQLSFAMDDETEYIPMLCGRNASADALKEFVDNEESLEIWWQFDYLPDNLLFRLMVEKKDELDTDHVWLTGAVFRKTESGQRALVRREGNALKFYALGNAAHPARDYLKSVEDTVYSIIKSEFKGLLEPDVRDQLLLPSRREELCDYPGIDRQIVYKSKGKRETFDSRRLKLGQRHGVGRYYSHVEGRAIPAGAILDMGSGGDVLTAELVENVVAACQKLQGNRHFWTEVPKTNTRNGLHENPRNTYIRDMLDVMYYHTQDQTLNGESLNRNQEGELDILIKKDPKTPWAIFEALNYKDKTYWQNHLEKLLEHYNPQGIDTLFLVTYVTKSRESFDHVCGNYLGDTDKQGHIREWFPAGSRLLQDSWRDIRPEGSIRISACRYDCGDYKPTVYHIFLRLGENAELEN